MALLPHKYLNTVVTIGKSDQEDIVATGQRMNEIATGFLYAYPALGTTGNPTLILDFGL